MDVIALHQAGFGGAVAPLGTALTEEQLEELWRLSPAPVLCFDGDAAGARAAARAAELALPLLAPDRTLQLARCRPARTPTAGAPAAARRRSRRCWTRPARWPTRCTTCCARPAATATPEQRAAFLAPAGRGGAAASRTGRWPANTARRLRGPVLCRRRQRRDQRRGRRRLPARRRRRRPAAPLAPPPRPLPANGRRRSERARILTAILLRHPDLLHDVEHAYAGARRCRPPLASVARCHPGMGGNAPKSLTRRH